MGPKKTALNHSPAIGRALFWGSFRSIACTRATMCHFLENQRATRSERPKEVEDFTGGSTTAPGRQLRGMRAPGTFALLKHVTNVTGAKKFFWRRALTYSYAPRNLKL